MSEISSFVALLVQADELGASIGPVLRAQSELLRTQRFQAAEKAGAQAAQKILFPLVFCILPAVFIVIFGPIALSFISLILTCSAGVTDKLVGTWSGTVKVSLNGMTFDEQDFVIESLAAAIRPS